MIDNVKREKLSKGIEEVGHVKNLYERVYLFYTGSLPLTFVKNQFILGVHF
jgi:hypothetical protein